MEHLKRNPTKFEVYDTAQAVARQQGLSIGEKEELQQVIQHMEQSLIREAANPIMQHGRHTEAMFGYVASALGHALIVKQEDTGEVISKNVSIAPPDYRIVLPEKNEFFVEVKNVHKPKATDRLVFKDSYIAAIEAYAATFDRPLKLAIYWSNWNKWTLIAADKLIVRNGKRSINMLEAVKINEMALLGDFMIGTKVPLTLRLVTDVNQPAIIDENGETNFTVGKAEIYCAGKQVQGIDSKLAWYMMIYGKWSDFKQIPDVSNGRLIAIDNVISPEEWEPAQGFAIIGDLSEMISKQFEHHTAPGETGKIRPLAEPNEFGITVPQNYTSDAFPLWRFTIRPNYNS